MKKILMVMFISFLMVSFSGCASNPSVSSLTSFERQKVVQMAILKPNSIPKGSYKIIGPVEGIACKRNLYASGSPSMNEAKNGVRIRAAQLGADAVINMVCEEKKEVDWIRNCWQTVVCVGDAVVVNDKSLLSRQPKPQNQEPSIVNAKKKISSSGTGFFITNDGNILTCLHVVKDAARIEIYVGDKMYQASLIRKDPNNDLAILKVDGHFSALAFSPYRSAKMGADVFTVGYPNPSLQGVSAKYTKGTISSLTGVQDDLRLYQISIPIQPGNSGGPLLDEYGNLLGIVVATLSDKTAFQMTGSLPQSVNYAVKSLYAQAMIDTMPGVAGKLLPPSKLKTDAIDHAQQSTVMVVCYD